MKHWSESTDFKHISAAIKHLKFKVERAYYECRDDDAAEAHDDLTSAEWRARAAKKREGK